MAPPDSGQRCLCTPHLPSSRCLGLNREPIQMNATIMLENMSVRFYTKLWRSHKHHALQYLHYPAVPCQVCATSRSWWGSFLSYTHSKTEIISEQTDKTITDQQTLEWLHWRASSHFTAAKVTVLSFTQTVSVCMCFCYTSTCLSCLFNHMTGCTRKSLKCVYTCEQCILTVITEVMQDRHKKKKII